MADRDESPLAELLRLRTRHAGALEALSHISGLLRRHACVIRRDRPADMHPDIREALAIATLALRHGAMSAPTTEPDGTRDPS